VDLLSNSAGGDSISALTENERKRLGAVWELFQSETVFLIDHLMVLKHVRIVSVSACNLSDLSLRLVCLLWGIFRMGNFLTFFRQPGGTLPYVFKIVLHLLPILANKRIHHARMDCGGRKFIY